MKAKVYLYENDQRELRVEVVPDYAISYDFNPPYEVSQELLDEYNKVMEAYALMQFKLRAVKGDG